MSRGRSRVVSLVAAAGLVLAGLLVPTASHGAGTGVLRIHVVDSSGQPLVGLLSVWNSSGARAAGDVTKESDHDFTLAPGQYGVVSMTPWGGILCRGVTPCDGTTGRYGTTMGLDAGAVTVPADGLVEVTLQAAPPGTVSGDPVVGGQLAVTPSPGIQSLIAWTVLTGYPATLGYQWLRDGQPVNGTSATYRPELADAGHTLSVRMLFGGAASYQVGAGGWGGDVTARTIAGPVVRRVAARAFVTLNRTQVTTAQRAIVRADVSAGAQIVPGKVTVTVGKRTWNLPLRNGQARIELPKLKKGKYAVRASYAGNANYLPAKSPSRTLVVKAAPKRKPRQG